MTGSASRPGAGRRPGTGPLAGAGMLTRLAFRRDRLMLPPWVYVLTALIAGNAYSFKTLFKTAAERDRLAATATSRLAASGACRPTAAEPASSVRPASSSALVCLITRKVLISPAPRATYTP